MRCCKGRFFKRLLGVRPQEVPLGYAYQRSKWKRYALPHGTHQSLPCVKGGAAQFRGPGEAQRQRIRWGEEEQRSDCAFRPQGGNKGSGACDDEAERLMLGSNLSLGTARLFGSS